MRWSPRLAMALIVLLATACNAASDQPVNEPSDSAPTNEEATDTAAGPDQQPDQPTPPGTDDLAAIWTEFLTAWLDQAAAEQPDPSAFEGLTVDPDRTVEALTRQRGDSRLVTTDTEVWPRFDIDRDRAEVVDCAIAVQHPEGQPDSVAAVTISWEATAVGTDDGWRIDDASQLDLFCIAEDLNEELLVAYTTWLEAHTDWYEPPDPEHPLLQATMAEPGLSDMRAVLADDRDAGIAMRFPHDTQAAVTEVDLETARITDCYEAPDGYGAFDIESGDRRADIVPAPEPGQLNRTIADLERTEDGCRVAGWRWEEQNNCEPGETRYVPR